MLARARLRIGRSTHSLDQLRSAALEPIDYAAFGPLFGTQSKDSPYAPRGLAQLTRAVALAASLPLVAIGGIDLTRARSVAATGVAGIAVISAIAGAPDAATATAATSHLVAAIEDSARVATGAGADAARSGGNQAC